MKNGENSLFVEHPLILKENVDHFVPVAGEFNMISEEGAPEYIYGIEETAELIQSICKLVRKGCSKDDAAEEMAHVYITLANLRKLFDIPLLWIQNEVDKKMLKYDLKIPAMAKTDKEGPKTKKHLIELIWNTNKRADRCANSVMRNLIKELTDECEANAEHVSMSFNQVIFHEGGLHYLYCIDIQDGIDGGAYDHIMDICGTLHDVWHWSMNVMKGV